MRRLNHQHDRRRMVTEIFDQKIIDTGPYPYRGKSVRPMAADEMSELEGGSTGVIDERIMPTTMTVRRNPRLWIWARMRWSN